MYERFSDRARKVMHLANQEAQRFNHEYIGTEHILIGIVKEGGGVAAEVLKHLGVKLGDIRKKVEERISPGPQLVSIGKLPQTPRAKKAIEGAMEEARNLNHNYVGTEHILLGLINEVEGHAAVVLSELGVTGVAVRTEIANFLSGNTTLESAPTADSSSRTWTINIVDPAAACRHRVTVESVDEDSGELLEIYSQVVTNLDLMKLIAVANNCELKETK